MNSIKSFIVGFNIYWLWKNIIISKEQNFSSTKISNSAPHITIVVESSLDNYKIVKFIIELTFEKSEWIGTIIVPNNKLNCPCKSLIGQSWHYFLDIELSFVGNQQNSYIKLPELFLFIIRSWNCLISIALSKWLQELLRIIVLFIHSNQVVISL